jgi:tetratricopeptide (TPR) repeat protein
MSSILRALKKADELRSAAAAGTRMEKFVYRDTNHAATRSFIVVICMAILTVCGMYLVYAKPSFRDVFAVMKKSAGTAPADPLPAGQPASPQTVSTDSRQHPAAASEVSTISPEDMNGQAIQEIRAGQHAKAEELLKKAISLQQGNAELHNNLGMALKFQSRYTEAIASYEKALSLKPDYPEALNNLAVVTELSGYRQKALKLYTKAITHRPSYAEAHLNVGLLLEAMGNLTEAENHFLLFLNFSKDPALKERVTSKLSTLRK